MKGWPVVALVALGCVHVGGEGNTGSVFVDVTLGLDSEAPALVTGSRQKELGQKGDTVEAGVVGDPETEEGGDAVDTDCGGDGVDGVCDRGPGGGSAAD